MKQIDFHAASYFIYMIVICLTSMAVSSAAGTDALYYAGMPVMIFAVHFLLFTVFSEHTIEGMLTSRLRRRKITDAILLMRSGVLVSLIVSCAAAAVFCVGAKAFSALVLKEQLSSLTMMSLSVFIILGGAAGAMKGFLSAAGMRRYSEYSMYVLSASTVIFSVLMGFFMQRRGEKVGLLLQNSNYASVYSAAGIGFGMSASMLIMFLYLVVMCALVIRGLERQEDALQIEHDEQMSGIMPFYFRKTFPGWLFAFFPGAALITDYRIAILQGEGISYGPVSSVHWGSFMGVTLPCILSAGCLISIPFTKFPRSLAEDYQKKKKTSLQRRLTLMMRLTGYCSVPAAFFLLSAAKPVVQIFHAGMVPAAREGGAAAMQFGAFMVPLFVCSALLTMYALYSQKGRLIFLSGLIALIGQTAAMFGFVRIVPRTIEAVSLSLTVFFFLYPAALILIGRRDLMRRFKSAWIIDWLLVAAAALIASLPVWLLSDFATNEIVAFGGMILLQILFTGLYIVMSLVLHAVDLRYADRIPFGRFIIRIAYVLHLG